MSPISYPQFVIKKCQHFHSITFYHHNNSLTSSSSGRDLSFINVSRIFLPVCERYFLKKVSGISLVLTDLLVMLFGFKADNLQDAGAGDVRHHVGYAFPNTQQSTTQHVVLTEAHALQTLVAFLNFLTLPIPKERTEKKKSHISCIQQKSPQVSCKSFFQENCSAGSGSAQRLAPSQHFKHSSLVTR